MAESHKSYKVEALFEVIDDEFLILGRMINAVCDAHPVEAHLTRVAELRNAWTSIDPDSHLGLAFASQLIKLASVIRKERINA